MTFWKTPSFIELQRAWYQRLEKEGFQDAEQLVGDQLVLKQIAAHPYRNEDQLGRTIKEAYFRLLGQEIQKAIFKSEVDRLILTMFADGHTYRAICRALDNLGTPRHRKTVRFTIRKYEMAWGLREYTPQQLNRKEAS